MKRFNGIVAIAIIVAAIAGIFLTSASRAQSDGKGSAKAAERLYVLDCGQGHATDQSRWSPGVNVGKPIDISVSCYLIRHGQEYFLWDTGISDEVAAMSNGWLPTNNPATDILDPPQDAAVAAQRNWRGAFRHPFHRHFPRASRPYR